MFYSGDVQNSLIDTIKHAGDDDYQCSVRVVNTSGKDIYVADRHGLRYLVRPMSEVGITELCNKHVFGNIKIGRGIYFVTRIELSQEGNEHTEKYLKGLEKVIAKDLLGMLPQPLFLNKEEGHISKVDRLTLQPRLGYNPKIYSATSINVPVTKEDNKRVRYKVSFVSKKNLDRVARKLKEVTIDEEGIVHDVIYDIHSDFVVGYESRLLVHPSLNRVDYLNLKSKEGDGLVSIYYVPDNIDERYLPQYYHRGSVSVSRIVPMVEDKKRGLYRGGLYVRYVEYCRKTDQNVIREHRADLADKTEEGISRLKAFMDRFQIFDSFDTASNTEYFVKLRNLELEYQKIQHANNKLLVEQEEMRMAAQKRIDELELRLKTEENLRLKLQNEKEALSLTREKSVRDNEVWEKEYELKIKDLEHKLSSQKQHHEQNLMKLNNEYIALQQKHKELELEKSRLEQHSQNASKEYRLKQSEYECRLEELNFKFKELRSRNKGMEEEFRSSVDQYEIKIKKMLLEREELEYRYREHISKISEQRSKRKSSLFDKILDTVKVVGMAAAGFLAFKKATA